MSGSVGTGTDAAVGAGGSALLGGIAGGVVGSAAFGLLMWALAPEFLRASIPALYGLEPAGAVGWAIHLLHGAILGAVFGLIVSRNVVAAWITVDVATPVLAGVGPFGRLVAAGFVYGLAVWAILPVAIVPVWTDVVGFPNPFTAIVSAVPSMVGHALFGVMLGAVYALVVRST